MLKKKYAQPIFVILMSFSMSVIMCGVVVAVNTGMSEGFLGRWFYSWIFAFPVALIACLLYTSPSPRDLDLSRMPSSA